MNRIAEERKKAKITQQELAEILKVDRSTVSKWETGEAFPTGSKLPQVAKALGCPINDLFSESNAEKSAKQKRKRRRESA